MIRWDCVEALEELFDADEPKPIWAPAVNHDRMKVIVMDSATLIIVEESVVSERHETGTAA